MQTKQTTRIQQMTAEALEQLHQALAQGQSEVLQAYLAAMARFHRYSLSNQLLIAFQSGGRATHVAGFNAWKKLKRFVKKGEKGIVIMAPILRPTSTVGPPSEEGSMELTEIRCLVNIKPVYVFDVSQTDGQPLPEFATVSGDPAGYTDRLKALLASKGIALEYSEDLGGALGASSGKKIRIAKGLGAAEEFAVLVHELAHSMLHTAESRAGTTLTIRETEAEAVAFVVCHAVGLNTGTASSDYIQLYQGDTKTLAASLDAIRTVANDIITAVSEK